MIYFSHALENTDKTDKVDTFCDNIVGFHQQNMTQCFRETQNISWSVAGKKAFDQYCWEPLSVYFRSWHSNLGAWPEDWINDFWNNNNLSNFTKIAWASFLEMSTSSSGHKTKWITRDHDSLNLDLWWLTYPANILKCISHLFHVGQAEWFGIYQSCWNERFSFYKLHIEPAALMRATCLTDFNTSLCWVSKFIESFKNWTSE